MQIVGSVREEDVCEPKLIKTRMLDRESRLRFNQKRRTEPPAHINSGP
jgi:hypothetical protein